MPPLTTNIDAIVNRIGTENVGLVWGLANVNWANDAELDDFLTAITNVQGG